MEIASFRALFYKALMAGIILFNNTLAYRAPGDKEPAAAYNTGDRVEIVGTREGPGEGPRDAERFYEIARGSETVLVPERSVRVFAEKADPNADSFPIDFYRRAAKNPNADARALGARGVLRRLNGRALLDAWMDFQDDQSDDVRCSANETLSARLVEEGVPTDRRFHDDLLEALARVSREGGWGERALCGLGEVLSRSSDPDKIPLQWLLAERGLGARPRAQPRDVARAQALLDQSLRSPEAWVRGNLLAQICGENVSTDTAKLLAARFPSLTPEDKLEVVEHDWYLDRLESARPLMRQIVGLVGDKSQPTKLRLAALDDGSSRVEKRDGLRKTVGDSDDAMRFNLADKYCEYRDVLEEIAARGDEATFARALMCLDGHAGKPGGIRFHEHLSAWAIPSLSAAVGTIPDPKRREEVARRLKCLLGQALCPVRLSYDPD